MSKLQTTSNRERPLTNGTGVCLVPQTRPEVMRSRHATRVNEPEATAVGAGERPLRDTHTELAAVMMRSEQQMHMLLRRPSAWASARPRELGAFTCQEACGSAQHLPYSEVVTSAPEHHDHDPGLGCSGADLPPEVYQYSHPGGGGQGRPSPLPVIIQICLSPVCPGVSGMGTFVMSHLGIWRRPLLGSHPVLNLIKPKAFSPVGTGAPGSPDVQLKHIF